MEPAQRPVGTALPEAIAALPPERFAPAHGPTSTGCTPASGQNMTARTRFGSLGSAPNLAIEGAYDVVVRDGLTVDEIRCLG